MTFWEAPTTGHVAEEMAPHEDFVPLAGPPIVTRTPTMAPIMTVPTQIAPKVHPTLASSKGKGGKGKGGTSLAPRPQTLGRGQGEGFDPLKQWDAREKRVKAREMSARDMHHIHLEGDAPPSDTSSTT